LYTPDRNIVKKVKEYDPDLYIKWNNLKQRFELWRKTCAANLRLNQKIEDQLITPITQRIYDTDKPNKFVQLDERILWWIHAADSHRQGGGKMMWLDDDRRWQQWQSNLDKTHADNVYNRAKDMWRDINNFYYGDKKKNIKGRYPKFNNALKKAQENAKFIKPDKQALTSKRLFARSADNARAYFKGK